MEEILVEFDNSRIVKKHKIKGETIEEIFRKGYASVTRSLRYCSGCYTKYENPVTEKKYLDWKANGGITIDLFYGGFVYD